MNRNINLQNIEAVLSLKNYTVHNRGITIEAIFELESFTITSKADILNFEGVVTYTLDTEYGGGPVTVNVEFVVNNGKLKLDFDEVDYERILDWKEIATESNITHAYIEDEDEEDENFNYHDNEDYDYSYEDEI